MHSLRLTLTPLDQPDRKSYGGQLTRATEQAAT
jgi:hypothetical protein